MATTMTIEIALIPSMPGSCGSRCEDASGEWVGEVVKKEKEETGMGCQ